MVQKDNSQPGSFLFRFKRNFLDIFRRNKSSNAGKNANESPLLMRKQVFIQKGNGPYRTPPKPSIKPNIHERDMTGEQRRRELQKAKILGPLYSQGLRKLSSPSPFPVRRKK